MTISHLSPSVIYKPGENRQKRLYLAHRPYLAGVLRVMVVEPQLTFISGVRALIRDGNKGFEEGVSHISG